MKYEYERSNPLPHLPMVYVRGEKYDYKDLYDLVGKSQSQTTYELKPGSPSFKLYGESVTGPIFYSKREWDLLAAGKTDGINLEKIKVDTALIEDGALTEKLKYEGINVADIEDFTYTTFIRPNEIHDTGEKVMPNVIELQLGNERKTDIDLLRQSYLVMKHNAGTQLILYEREQLIGLTLGINLGQIDSRILETFGFTVDQAGESQNIKYWLYTVRERRKTITDSQKDDFFWVKLGIFNRKARKFLSEMTKAGIQKVETAEKGYPYKELFKAMTDFEPSIVLDGKRQVYWDSDSYLHIVLRHVKEFQPGRYRTDKTPFPYKFKDLKMLIYKVLGSIQNEIERHFKEHPDKKFYRQGEMAVRFNGDYYGVNIDADGRLASFWCYE